jgi:hypothetical protein
MCDLSSRVCAEAARHLEIFFGGDVAASGHCDDAGARLLFLHIGDEFQTITVGHQHVGDNEIERFFL